MTLIALFLAVGGASGVVSMLIGAKWAERYTLLSSIVGWSGYLSMIIYLWAIQDGQRGMQALGVCGALMLTALRYLWIKDSPYSDLRSKRDGLKADDTHG